MQTYLAPKKRLIPLFVVSIIFLLAVPLVRKRLHVCVNP